jgi:putative membrane protein
MGLARRPARHVAARPPSSDKESVMRQFILTTFILAIMSLCAAASAADAALDKYDTKFLITAAHAGALEIRTSEMAQKRTLSPEETRFAKQIIDDHTAMAHELEALATKKGVVLPKDTDEKGQKKIDKLAATKDTDFPSAYADCQVSAHKDAVSLFKDAADDAKDPEVRAFASKYLPTLQQHLDHAKALAKSL